LFYLCKAADSIDAKCKSGVCDQCINKFLDKIPSSNNKKRRPRNKGKASRRPKFCPCGGDDDVLCDRTEAINWLRKLCRDSTEPPGILVALNLKDYEKKIVRGQQGTIKQDLIFCYPLFCLVCQRILGEGIRAILENEVNDDTEKKRSWHQLLAKAHTTWDNP